MPKKDAKYIPKNVDVDMSSGVVRHQLNSDVLICCGIRSSYIICTDTTQWI